MLIHLESMGPGRGRFRPPKEIVEIDISLSSCKRRARPAHRPQIQNHDAINRRSIVGFSRLADPAGMSSHFAEGSLFDPRFNLEAAGDRLVLRDILASFEKSLIVAALLAAGGNQRRAATALGVLPTTLQEKLKRFGLLDDRFGRRARPGGRAAHPGDNKGPRSEAENTPKEEQGQ